MELLFGGGRLGPADLDLIATTLLWFLTGLAAHALIAVLARAFYARQDTLTPVLAAIGAVAVNTTLAVVLVGPLGLGGIALAIAVAAWLEAIALIVVLRARVRAPATPGPGPGHGRGDRRLARGRRHRDRRGGARPSSSSAPTPARLALIGESVVVTLAFGLAFAAVSIVLRIPELASIVEVMVDVIRRPFRT